MLCWAPAGAGKIQILPSVRTPSTSKRMSLIFLARGLDIRAILALESSMIYQHQCRAQGISGSTVDFLICAVAHRRSWGILTTNQDFQHYASVLPLKSYIPA